MARDTGVRATMDRIWRDRDRAIMELIERAFVQKLGGVVRGGKIQPEALPPSLAPTSTPGTVVGEPVTAGVAATLFVYDADSEDLLVTDACCPVTTRGTESQLVTTSSGDIVTL